MSSRLSNLKLHFRIQQIKGINQIIFRPHKFMKQFTKSQIITLKSKITQFRHRKEKQQVDEIN